MSQSINTATLRSILNAKNGNTFVGVTYVGTLKASQDFRKRGNPYADDNIQKVVYMHGTFNHGYKSSADRRLDKIGAGATMTPDSLPWGSWSVFNKFITHKGEEYVRFYLEEGAKVEVRYLRNGVPMTASELATFKPFIISRPFYSNKQAALGLTQKQVHPVNPKLAGIVKLSMDNTEYEIVENAKYANVI